MKKRIILLNIINFYYLLFTEINTFAAWWKWLLEWVGWSKENLRNWKLHIEDIAGAIKWMIDIFLWLAWTIAVIFVIIWAYKLLFGSTKGDISKWRETIIMALTGFAISVLAWFIVKFIFDNFG